MGVKHEEYVGAVWLSAQRAFRFFLTSAKIDSWRGHNCIRPTGCCCRAVSHSVSSTWRCVSVQSMLRRDAKNVKALYHQRLALDALREWQSALQDALVGWTVLLLGTRSHI